MKSGVERRRLGAGEERDALGGGEAAGFDLALDPGAGTAGDASQGDVKTGASEGLEGFGRDDGGGTRRQNGGHDGGRWQTWAKM